MDPWNRIILRWNAKSAALSALFRGVIFLVASLKSHAAGRHSAALAEAILGALNAGLAGTFAQALRFATPTWLAELLLAGIFPVIFQLTDFGMHRALGHQQFQAGMISSAVFTALSAAFNLYIMRRGTMLVGGEGQSFLKDLRRLPVLALRFVASGIMRILRVLRLTQRANLSES
jgi:hypothetical protein